MVTVFLIGLVAITPSRAQFTGKATFLVILLAYISREKGRYDPNSIVGEYLDSRHTVMSQYLTFKHAATFILQWRKCWDGCHASSLPPYASIIL